MKKLQGTDMCSINDFKYCVGGTSLRTGICG